MLHLKRLVMFLDALQKYALEWKEKNTKVDGFKVEVMTVTELLDRLGRKVNGVNLLEIESYLKKSKVNMFRRSDAVCFSLTPLRGVDRKENFRLFRQRSRKTRWRCFNRPPPSLKFAALPDPKLRPKRGAVPPLHAVEAFLLALTGVNEGRHAYTFAPFS